MTDLDVVLQGPRSGGICALGLSLVGDTKSSVNNRYLTLVSSSAMQVF